MRKILFFVLSIFIFSVLGSSCNDQKTPREMLEEENKAINRFITKNGFKILDKMPENGVFGEKEYYRDAAGLYIRVIEYGDTTAAMNEWRKNKTICGRYTGLIYIKVNDTLRYNTGVSQPDEFKYGTGSFGNGQACVAWHYALNYVGDDSEVSLIIPSKIGTSSNNSNYQPVYYESLRFVYY